MRERVLKLLDRTVRIDMHNGTHEIRDIESLEFIYPYQLLDFISLTYGLTTYSSKKFAEEWFKGHDIIVGDKYWISWGAPVADMLVKVRPEDMTDIANLRRQMQAHRPQPFPVRENQNAGLEPIHEQVRVRQSNIVQGLE